MHNMCPNMSGHHNLSCVSHGTKTKWKWERKQKAISFSFHIFSTGQWKSKLCDEAQQSQERECLSSLQECFSQPLTEICWYEAQVAALLHQKEKNANSMNNNLQGKRETATSKMFVLYKLQQKKYIQKERQRNRAKKEKETQRLACTHNFCLFVLVCVCVSGKCIYSDTRSESECICKTPFKQKRAACRQNMHIHISEAHWRWARIEWSAGINLFWSTLFHDKHKRLCSAAKADRSFQLKNENKRVGVR